MERATLCVHGGHSPDSDTLSRGVPVYRTTSYQFKDTQHAANLFALKELGNIYTRIGNPTQAILEERLAQLEGGKAAVATSSGTAAIFYAITNICASGDEIVSAKQLYGGTFTMFDSILPQFGITTKFVDVTRPGEFGEAISPKTKLIFLETIGNPTLDVADIEEIAKVAHENGLPLIVDSTFTPPVIFRPLEHGADVVIHSLTKWIGGHGTALGGVIVDSGHFDWKGGNFPLLNEADASYHGLRYTYDLGDLSGQAFAWRVRLVGLRNIGASISPDNAWTFLQGLETLELRMERHCSNAFAAARYLAANPHVSWVRYPGLVSDPSHRIAGKYLKNRYGGMVVFGIKGGSSAGAKFINSLKLFSHVANVGDAKSLAIHPASTTHSQLSAEQQLQAGIPGELVRLSIGIEHIDDIVEDLEKALFASQGQWTKEVI